MNNIAYIDRETEIKTYLELKNLYPHKEILCIAGNAVTMKRLQAKGEDCVSITKYQKREEQQQAMQAAVTAAELWFRNKEGEDLLRYGKISLGKAFKFPISFFFNHVIKAINIVLNILEMEHPETVVMVDNPLVETNPSLYFDMDMHKVVLKWLAEKKGYQIISLPMDKGRATRRTWRDIGGKLEWIRIPILSGTIHFWIPKPLLEVLKRFLIFLVDGSKNFYYSRLKHNSSDIRILVLSASDLNYLGGNLIRQLSRYSHRIIYYLENERNCFFNLGLLNIKKERFTHATKTESVQQFLTGLNDIHGKLRSEAETNPQLKYRDIPIFELCENFFDGIFTKEIPSLLNFQAQAYEVFQTTRIDILITTNTQMPKSVILAQIASQFNVPVLQIPHGHNYGFILEKTIHLHYGVDTRYFPVYYSHEAVGLKINFHLLAESRGSSEKLILAGLPKFEKKITNHNSLRKKVREQLGFGKEEDVLLLATSLVEMNSDKLCIPAQFDSFESLQMYETILALYAKRSQSRLVFKFRPGDILFQITKEMVSQQGLTNTSFFTHHLENLLSACDAVLVCQSNVGIEALYYDIPILQYLTPEKLNTLPLSIEGAAIEIRDLEELPRILDRLKGDKNYREERIKAQRQFIKNNLPEDNLTSVARVVQIIDRLALTGDK